MEGPGDRQGSGDGQGSEDWHRYLHPVPWQEALRKWLDHLRGQGWQAPLSGERVPVDQALHRITAEAVRARASSPHYAGAAMDGIAVKAADTFGANEAHPVILEPGQYSFVHTGQALVAPYDAVVMIEEVERLPAGRVLLRQPAVPWQDVRPVGEDIVASEMVLPENHRIRPVDIGALLAAGVTRVSVRPQPRVAILPTGGELVDVLAVPEAEGLPAGAIPEFNSYVLAGLVQEWGGVPVRLAPAPDDPRALQEAVEQALDGGAHVVVINAGSSAGPRDRTAGVVAKLGSLVVHGVATRPGKPVILGQIGGKPVLGIPGFPVSAVLAAELFLRPLLMELLGTVTPQPVRVRAVMTRRLASPGGVEEFVRVQLGRVGERLLALPLSRGAGVIMSLVRADGWVRLPAGQQGVEEGQEAEVELFGPPDQAERTLVFSGSHDPALDLLATALSRKLPGARMSISAVGSLGGLLAIRRGYAHLAGSHLLDEASGQYNFPFIRRYLAGEDVVVVNFVHRQQGFIVAPGNPLGIRDVADLARPGVRFVNRQRGAGTRVLLDLELKRRGLRPAQIAGYEREEYNHLAVAAAVKSGSADVGLGLYSAARAVGTGFVPLAEERYDFVVPRRFLQAPLVQAALEILRQPAFARQVEALGGYDTRDMGQVLPAPPVS